MVGNEHEQVAVKLPARKEVRLGCPELVSWASKALLRLDRLQAPEPRCLCWGHERLAKRKASRATAAHPPSTSRRLLSSCHRTGQQFCKSKGAQLMR